MSAAWLLGQAALLVTACGLATFLWTCIATRRVQEAVALLLEFLTAAALIRLAAQPSWSSLATTAVVIAIRKVVVAGLRFQHPSAEPR
ncbi:DUF1622 domain-containing protein [Nonomuraea typhae]|uniref:DUF1622 domain-containing protein n=1 Tax=Nonomuraea typhae TaxID=2603600 RepID=UPI0012F7828F|nr:DUF1622 domain-containing protein [Nonomuraea typhae]